ncbi:ABC transporter ATP-binding protein [Glaciihabitans sp. INWT7]|uniref:ABC transporter ATP-binding protein n=1 Tax=Glaciihabitans sp. INWT7 TaxID=2596912 RepID=UPI0016291447|nr:ABC transporter ATP-binding protein [Glaciihabitans sp. INWT7]QNE48069.1 ABC transporter ATP-binding protein [Glaciihabitans sp. INWT7]
MNIAEFGEPSLTAQKSAAIRIDGLTKRFGRRGQQATALSDVSITVKEHEFLCIVGRSGCGKSTMLNVIADLETPTDGTVDVGGRKVGMMFQDANLFPWLTVAGNIDLALKLSGVSSEVRPDRIRELLDIVQLPHVARKRPHELSGGMRQRVALARSLAQDCDILLMDEPFAALDAITRDAMHEQTERIWAERSLTVVFVTHNVREAARLADRIVVFKPNPGRVGSESLITIPRPRRMEDPRVAGAAAMLHDLLHTQEATDD